MCDRQQASKTFKCCPLQRRKCGTCPKAVFHSFEGKKRDDCQCEDALLKRIEELEERVSFLSGLHSVPP